MSMKGRHLKRASAMNSRSDRKALALEQVAKERAQGLEIRLAEEACVLLLDLGLDLVPGLEKLLAALGEDDEGGAAVVRVGDAIDVVLTFQLGDEMAGALLLDAGALSDDGVVRALEIDLRHECDQAGPQGVTTLVHSIGGKGTELA